MRRLLIISSLVLLLGSCSKSRTDAPTERRPLAKQPPTTETTVKPAVAASAYSYTILEHNTPAEMSADSVVVVTVKVRNTSNRAWPAKGPILLGYYWLDAQGKRIAKVQGRARVQKDTPPDANVGIRCRVKAPPVKGSPTLVWDMIEDRTWFASKGAKTTRVPVKVT